MIAPPGLIDYGRTPALVDRVRAAGMLDEEVCRAHADRRRIDELLGGPPPSNTPGPSSWHLLRNTLALLAAMACMELAVGPHSVLLAALATETSSPGGLAGGLWWVRVSAWGLVAGSVLLAAAVAMHGICVHRRWRRRLRTARDELTATIATLQDAVVLQEHGHSHHESEAR